MCGQQYPCISITRCLAPETKCIGSADLKQVVSGIEAAFGPAQDYKPSADQVVMVCILQTLCGRHAERHTACAACYYAILYYTTPLWP